MSATLSHSAAPNGLGTITPYLTCAGAAEAIAFYKKAFGASEVMRLAGPDGKIWGGRFGMVADPFGHKWSLAKHLRDMTADEIHAAMAKVGG